MRPRTILLSAGAILLLIALGIAISPATARPAENPPQAPQAQIEDSQCLFCHGQEGMKIQLESGETLSLTINAEAFAASTHGTNQVACLTCHAENAKVPHPARETESIRDVKLKYYTSCQQCHTEQFNKTLDSVHQQALAAGNKNAAVCADCHNPHTQRPMAELPRSEIPRICSNCHSAIYNQYAESVHGSALIGEGNPDVPTCIDCHGVHNIPDPTTQEFRLKSPTEMCGRCHTNPAIMDKYGISTQVLNTYVADFHGTTVTLFEKQAPDQATNKPVCFDCHGVHNIARADDPQKGLQTRTNLLLACQKCHPDATTEAFTDAWMSHYIPSQDKYPIVYYVDLFYKFFIPAVLVPMAVLVVMDFSRLMINRFRKPKPQAAQPDEPVQVEEPPTVPVETPQVEETPLETEDQPQADEPAEPSPGTETAPEVESGAEVESAPASHPDEAEQPEETQADNDEESRHD